MVQAHGAGIWCWHPSFRSISFAWSGHFWLTRIDPGLHLGQAG